MYTRTHASLSISYPAYVPNFANTSICVSYIDTPSPTSTKVSTFRINTSRSPATTKNCTPRALIKVVVAPSSSPSPSSPSVVVVYVAEERTTPAQSGGHVEESSSASHVPSPQGSVSSISAVGAGVGGWYDGAAVAVAPSSTGSSSSSSSSAVGGIVAGPPVGDGAGDGFGDGGRIIDGRRVAGGGGAVGPSEVGGSVAWVFFFTTGDS